MKHAMPHSRSMFSSDYVEPARTGCWSVTTRCALAVAMLVALAPAAHAMETLTYKGSLRDGGKEANGSYDIQVQLFTAEIGGTPVTSPITLYEVQVTDGSFDVPVDLPGKLPTDKSVWLQAEVKPMGSSVFYPLAGRQEIDSTLGGGTCWETTGNASENGGLIGIPGTAPGNLLRVQNRGSSLYFRADGGVEQNSSTASGATSVALNSSQASAANSFTAGKGRTAAGHDYSVVFADGQAPVFTSTAANQFLVRAQNGMGINTSAPLGALSVRLGGASGVNSIASPSVITGESDANTYLSLLTPSTKERGVLFGDPGNTASGGIIYNNAANPLGLTFRANGNVDKLRVTSNGALIVNPNGLDPLFDNGLNIKARGTTTGSLAEIVLIAADGQSHSNFVVDNDGELYIGSGTGKMYHSSRVGILRNAVANDLEVDGNASKGTAGAWLANSDRRIKTDIVPISDALSLINRVEPVTFRYNKAYLDKNSRIVDQRYYNVIAQDFAKVFPTAVKGSGEYLSGMAKTPENEILQVDTYPATITSIAAIQELDAKASLQNDRIENLEAENLALRDRLAALEKALLGHSVDAQH